MHRYKNKKEEKMTGVVSTGKGKRRDLDAGQDQEEDEEARA